MLFFRRKYSIADSGLFRGLTDYHSHVLPGVDDGIQSFDESMRVLKEYERLGLNRLYLTPHMMDDYPENRPALLREKFNAFGSCYCGGIELCIAGEYMLDYTFWKALKEGESLLTAGNRRLLVELPFLNGCMDVEHRLNQIQERGYTLILAHPERYLSLSMDNYRELKSSGILFQLNLFSLAGAYGLKVRRQAIELLDKNFYNYIGCDVHGYDSFMNYLRVKAFPSKLIAQLEYIKEYSS